MTTPNPGSKEAIEQGCLCPRMDNNNGLGVIVSGKALFWYAESCPLHCGDYSEIADKSDD